MNRIVLIVCTLFYSCLTYAQDTTRLSLLFLGDIMQHDSQISAAYRTKTSTYDYAPCFQFVKPYIQEADLAIGNLELTLAGPPYKGYPQFSAPDNLALTLKSIGMDVLVTANNHSADRRRKGIDRTIQVLDSLGIMHTGTFRDTVERMNDYPLMLYKNGFKLALLNYTYGTNGIPVTEPNVVNLIDTALIRQDLIKAKSNKPDAIIVFMHWGLEYQSQPSREQKQLTEFCFKHGAQLVIGSHPHVLQPMEWREAENRLVVYSLGNFVSGQRDRYKNGGAMVRVELTKAGTDSSSSTVITKSEYILEWVYRTADSKKEYYILPVPSFERDSLNVMQDEASRQAFKTFVKDSRQLFSTYNVGVTERTQIPTDSLITYKVLFMETDQDTTEWIALPHTKGFYGIERSEEESGKISWYSGNFRTPDEAGKHLLEFKAYKDARVVRFVNGIPVD